MRKLGLDVGGTAIKYGECNDAGEIIEQFSMPTEADKGAEPRNAAHHYVRA